MITKKQSLLMIVGLISCLFSMSAAATVFSSAIAKMTSGTQPVATVTTITPGNTTIYLDGWKTYEGYSRSAPCSDIHLKYQYSSNEDGSWDESPEIQTIFASELHESFSDLGTPLATCVRTDDIYHGKIYSTGNIVIKWDEKTGMPLSITPNHIVVDYTK